MTELDAERIEEKAETPSLERKFKAIADIDDAMQVFRAGTPEEKRIWGEILEDRIFKLLDTRGKKPLKIEHDVEKFDKLEPVLQEIAVSGRQRNTNPWDKARPAQLR